MKPETFALSLLAATGVLVKLDPRMEGVEAPPWLRYQSSLVLHFAHDMAIPIPDLVVNERGIGGTLSFARTPFRCWVPWTAAMSLYPATDEPTQKMAAKPKRKLPPGWRIVK